MLECANYLARRGHEVHALASQWDDLAVSSQVVRHPVELRLWPAFASMPSYVSASRRMLAGLRPPPDVVASFGVASPPGSVVWMTSVHAAWIAISQQTRGIAGRWKQRLNPFHPVILRMERKLLRGRPYRKVIALTAQVQADLEHYYHVPASDIAVLPNGYSPEEFNPERSRQIRARARQQLGYQVDHRVIVFVANEMERKGFFPLLRAVAQRRDPSLRVLAVGRLNPLVAAPEIRTLGLGGRVHFTGPTSDTADFYAAADVFVLPTKYEAWGLVIIEAMACGLPVLTSRLAGAAVAVEEGRAGWLLDDCTNPDEIAQKLGLLLDGKHADADAIARSVQKYRWDQILADYEKILADAAGVRL